jgi:hypothetical protein
LRGSQNTNNKPIASIASGNSANTGNAVRTSKVKSSQNDVSINLVDSKQDYDDDYEDEVIEEYSEDSRRGKKKAIVTQEEIDDEIDEDLDDNYF